MGKAKMAVPEGRRNWPENLHPLPGDLRDGFGGFALVNLQGWLLDLKEIFFFVFRSG